MYWVQLETEQAIEEKANVPLWSLAKAYWDDARKTVYDYDTDGTKYINTPKQIVLHHTAWETCDPNRISIQHKNDPKKWTNGMNTSLKRLPVWVNKTWGSWEWEYSDVRYHFIIQADWTIDITRYESEVGRWTRVNNIDVIHIAFCWNFTDYEPSVEQYKQWWKLIWELRERHWDMPVEVHGHLDWEATSCAGEMFDINKLSFYTPTPPKEKEITIHKSSNEGRVDAVQEKIENENYLGEFSITRYYSCDPTQTKYLSREVNVLKKKLWRDPSNEELYTECNRRQFNWDPDNTQPKHWARYTNNDAWIAVACPKEFAPRTELMIEGYNTPVVCRDVGSAITQLRLDVFVWIWNYWVENFDNYPSWKRKVYIIKK